MPRRYWPPGGGGGHFIGKQSAEGSIGPEDLQDPDDTPAPTMSHRPAVSALFSSESVERHMGDLTEALDARGVEARIELVGGAAMALVHYEGRPLTTDIDGSLHPRDEVLEEAAKIARRDGLPASWLSDAATMYLPPDPPEFVEVMRRGKVVVSVAPPGLLLAMKLAASRPEKDFEDIAILLRICEVRSVEEAVAHLEELLPEEAMPQDGYDLVEAALGEVILDTSPPRRLEGVMPRPPRTTCGRHVWWADDRCTMPPDHKGECSVAGKTKRPSLEERTQALRSAAERDTV